MILSALNQLADSVSPTTAATSYSTNYIDLTAKKDLGAGELLIFYMQIAAAFTTSSSGTLQVVLEGDPSDPAFGGTLVTLADTGTVAAATLVKGYEFKIDISRANPVRYIRLKIIVGTGAMTAGTFNAWITNDDVQDNRAYAAGYTVL